MKTIDIVVPCYNEEDSIRPFYDKLQDTLAPLNNSYIFNYYFVDDGSKDKTLEQIKSIAENGQVYYISLARNFGKEAALYAGLEKCTAEYVIVMDADLQHPPELIPEMIQIIEKEDIDCVGARRVSRKGEPLFKSILSQSFYYVINSVTGMKLVPGMTDFRLMKRSAVDAILSMHERERFIKGIYSWIGFKTKWLEYENVERQYGTSKWSVKGLWNYAKSGFIAFATTPLRGIVYLGMLVVVASFVYAIRLLVQVSVGSRVWQDSTTIILLLLFLGGVIITVLGIIGEYIARIYMEVKGRPIYISRESNVGKNE